MKKLQRRLCDGNWDDEDRLDMFIEKAAQFQKISRSEIERKLDIGEAIKFDYDWYAEIRFAPTEKSAEQKRADDAKWQSAWKPQKGFHSDGSPEEYD